ncbi:unnamed protein product [Caretta caretta]
MNRTAMAVTKAGLLDGIQEVVQTCVGLILEFYMPGILLLGKQAAITQNCLYCGKMAWREEAPGFKWVQQRRSKTHFKACLFWCQSFHLTGSSVPGELGKGTGAESQISPNMVLIQTPRMGGGYKRPGKANLPLDTFGVPPPKGGQGHGAGTVNRETPPDFTVLRISPCVVIITMFFVHLQEITFHMNK